ncbi:MAG: hypothetical protein EWV82_17950, partial [Microcystis aeruginosa Ma_AC_P_19900807_S299]
MAFRLSIITHRVSEMLPKLSKLIGSRDINYYQPDQIKRVRILNRADGYYVQFCIKLDPRDT